MHHFQRNLMCSLYLICFLLASLAPKVSNSNLGIGLRLETSSWSYKDALRVLKSQGVQYIKTWSINSSWLHHVENMFGKDSVEVTVAIPNSELWDIYNNPVYINRILGNLKKFRGIIRMIEIGDDPFHEVNRDQVMSHLLSAFNSMINLLSANGLRNYMKVTIPFSSVVLINTIPVSNTVFHPDIIGTMRVITATLKNTGSKFSIKLYPYIAYSYSNDISLNYALGRDGSLFEAMLCGCRAALSKIGASSLPLIVGETGWPSKGGLKGTTVENTKEYTKHIIEFAKSNFLADVIYLYEAFDESGKSGKEFESHFGICYGNLQPKFYFKLGDGRPCYMWNWRFYDFYDIIGYDITSKVTKNRNECQSLCKNLLGCKGYSWFKNTCYFKLGAHTFKSNISVYSALTC